MFKFKTGLLATAAAGLVLMASSAFAGPTWTFGPEDEGLMKIEYKGQFQLDYRDTGSGANGDDSSSEFNFRRNRIALMGFYKGVGLYFQTEYNEDNNINSFSVGDGDNADFRVIDAQFRYKVNDAVQFRIGKYKYNFTRENLEACEAPLTLDRSLMIRAPFVETRDKGVTLWGNLFDGVFQYRLDAMNGRNDSASAPDSNFRYGARAHVTLLDGEKGYGYKGTYMGEKKVITIGGAYQMEQDIAYADCTNETDAVDYKAWTVDLFAEYPIEDVGTFTFSTAYVDYDLDDAFKGFDPDDNVLGLNGEKNGGYTKIAYMLPNTPLQFFARAENWSFAGWDDGTSVILDQEVDWYGGGINYYFYGQDLKITLEYSTVDYDKETKNCEDFDTLTAQIQVIF
ncbi:MAG: selenite/tellurite reduction operon porin ExtI [Desulfuromonas sp.]|nr:selenite/tellurite reduction operon porin ExtI [Desulfuromonas sp.]